MELFILRCWHYFYFRWKQEIDTDEDTISNYLFQNIKSEITIKSEDLDTDNVDAESHIWNICNTVNENYVCPNYDIVIEPQTSQIDQNYKKMFHCDICNKSFSRKNNRDVHRNIHTKEKVFQCDYCDQTFLVKPYLTRHLATKHNVYDNDGNPLKCDICGKIFNRTTLFKIHQNVHKEHKCRICNKLFSKQKYLAAHLQRHNKWRYRRIQRVNVLEWIFLLH